MAGPRRKGPAKRVGRVSERASPHYGPARLLLDTHTWLWWKADSRQLSPAARRAIVDAPEVFLSAASVWEVVIKAALGKLVYPQNASFAAELERDGFRALAVGVAHAERVRALPALHRDPFDRMLIAQATVEGLTLVTADPVFARYGVSVLAAD